MREGGKEDLEFVRDFCESHPYSPGLSGEDATSVPQIVTAW